MYKVEKHFRLWLFELLWGRKTHVLEIIPFFLCIHAKCLYYYFVFVLSHFDYYVIAQWIFCIPYIFNVCRRFSKKKNITQYIYPTLACVQLLYHSILAYTNQNYYVTTFGIKMCMHSYRVGISMVKCCLNIRIQRWK